jgi:uncharacterized membrane protein
MSGHVIVQVAVGAIEFIGSIALCAFLSRSLLLAIWNQDTPTLAQRAAADGIILALDFKLAATILKTLLLTGWQQIRLFVVVLVIRTVVKRQMVWIETPGHSMIVGPR